MSDTMVPHAAALFATFRVRPRIFGETSRLVVACVYAAALLAAPMIVRYAPAPSATPIAVGMAVGKSSAAPDCTGAAGAPDCLAAAQR